MKDGPLDGNQQSNMIAGKPVPVKAFFRFFGAGERAGGQVDCAAQPLLKSGNDRGSTVRRAKRDSRFRAGGSRHKDPPDQSGAQAAAAAARRAPRPVRACLRHACLSVADGNEEKAVR